MELLTNYGMTDLKDLTVDDIDTVQIAKALSRITRFAGNFAGISVAQHAVIVSQVVEALGGSTRMQLAALHHDDAEVFIGDVPGPVKAECPALQEIESSILDVIDEKYGCDTRDKGVAGADKIVSSTEMMHHINMSGVLARIVSDLSATDAAAGLRITNRSLIEWGPDVAFARYVDLHESLVRGIAKDVKADDDKSSKGEIN